MERQIIKVKIYLYNATDNEVYSKYTTKRSQWEKGVRMKDFTVLEPHTPPNIREIYSNFTVSAGQLRTADPITSGMAKSFSAQLKEFFLRPVHSKTSEIDCEVVYVIGGQEIYIEKPYALNGTKMSLKEIGYKLSRITMAFGSIVDRFTEEEIPVQTKKAIIRIIKTPEDILYCLENRTPYYFYDKDSLTLEKVRLNLKQVGHSDYALEIADGKWGPIKEKELTTYLGHYLHNHNRGSWKLLSPKKLYTRIMGIEPKDSELKMMIAFLLQNRTQDLVEKRAKKLIDDLAIQHSDRILVIKGEYDRDGKPTKQMKILVKGEKADWLLVENINHYEGDTQRVSTFCLMTNTKSTYCREIEDLVLETTKNTSWYGPICIDTGGKNPSLGDQFASRVLSLMNDASAAMRVSTISKQMIESTDRIRIPLKEEYTNEGELHEYNELHGMSIQE